jgi:hypothetical protein
MRWLYERHMTALLRRRDYLRNWLDDPADPEPDRGAMYDRLEWAALRYAHAILQVAHDLEALHVLEAEAVEGGRLARSKIGPWGCQFVRIPKDGA